MKTVILINSLEKGGAERVVLTLLKNINVRETDSFYLFLLEDNIKYEIPNKVQVVIGGRFHNTNILKLLQIPLLAIKLKRICRKYQISTVLSFLERSNFTNVLSRLLGSAHKCIISERNTPSFVYQSQSLKDKINRFLIRSMYSHADQIVTVSDGVSQDLVENFSIPKDIITKINNPYEIDNIHYLSKEMIDEEWLNNDAYQTIINVGSLTKQKGHDILVKAFARLIHKFENLRLIIIGEGMERQSILSLIKELRIEDFVKLTGLKENPYAYMSRADIFVLSSFYEGFPNVLVEAMICECPVVSANCKSGPEEIIEDGQSGFLIPPGNIEALEKSIQKVLENPNLRQILVKNGLEKVNTYDVNTIIAQYERILLQP
jgi:N-acetylgalactosamine-N,N'-diacetylbacillosaminyl-diphospho-undecaprenol 4-alpha-N-acetylgalactosaminyltransferase